MADRNIAHSFQRILFWKDFVTEKLNTEPTDCPDVGEEVEEEQCCIDMSSAWISCGAVAAGEPLTDPLSLEEGQTSGVAGGTVEISSGALAAVQLLTDTLIPQGRRINKDTGKDMRSALQVEETKVEGTHEVNKDADKEVSSILQVEDIKAEVTCEEANREMLFAKGSVKQEGTGQTDHSLDPGSPPSVKIRQNATSAESVKSTVNGQWRHLRSHPPDTSPQSDVDKTCGDVSKGSAEERVSRVQCGNLPGSNGEPDVQSDERVEEQQYFCADCGKGFGKLVYLKVHMRIHTGLRPYVCQSCDRTFTTYAQLLSHSRVHTGERPYGCSFCEKAFKTKMKLEYHERAHRGERPYGCPDCELAFGSKERLTRHLRVHRGDRPFACAVCELAFRTRFNLKLHLRTHFGDALGSREGPVTNPTVFTCSVCGKSFKSKTKLTYHKRSSCLLGVYTPLLELCSSGDSRLADT